MKIRFSFYLWVGRYYKTLNDWPHGKQRVLFPLDLSVRLSFALLNIEGLGETNITGQTSYLLLYGLCFKPIYDWLILEHYCPIIPEG